VQGQLVEELLAVEIGAAAADLTAENRDAVGPAVVQIYILVHVLMATDAHVGLSRGQQYKTLHVYTWHGVVEELRVEPRHVTQVEKLHSSFISYFFAW
jgi:hypothetical protein